MTPLQERLRLGKGIGQQHVMHACMFARWFLEGDEINWVHLRALMEQLQKRMLTVGAGLSPNQRSRIPCDFSISPDGFPVALHVSLLEVSRQAAQIFGVRQNNMRSMPQKVLVPMTKQRQQHRNVVPERRLLEMTVDTSCTCQKKSKKPCDPSDMAMHNPTGPHME